MARISDLPLRKQTVDDVKAFVMRYRDDPVLFAEEICGLRLDKVQRHICDMVYRSDRSAVASARGCGKSTVAAFVALHYMVTRPNALVGLTSNTAEQTEAVLFRNIRSVLDKSAIHDWLDIKEDKITPAGRKEILGKRIIWDEKRIEAVSGYHSPHMLLIFDEASLIPAALINNLEKGCTEQDNRMLLISNPTRSSGYFYDCFKDGSGWETYQVSGYDSAFTNKDFLDAIVAKHGRDSDDVRMHVFGLFPRHVVARIISPELLDRWLRAVPTQGSGDAVLGIDVGAGGDDTVWVVRHGARIRHIVSKQTKDSDSICAETVRVVNECGVRWVCVDSTGVGALVPGDLQKCLPAKVRVESVNFGDASPEEDTYNMRAWIYRRLADLLRQHPEASFEGEREDLEAQVDATETFQDERSGKTRLVSKKLITASIGHSPDLLDAVALTCAIQGPLCRVSSIEDEEEEDAEMDSVIEQASKWL
jgi:hypothetical protein